MTRSLDYPGRKHPVIKPPAANGQIATGKMLKPMKSKNDERVPISGTQASGPQASGTQEQSPGPYDVHTKGSLTYFQFYLDEVVQSAHAAQPTKKRQSVSTTVLLGTGFVAATVVSGLLIGDALKPTASLNTKIPPLKPKQRAMVLVPRPTLAAPEKLEARRFGSRSQRESQPQAISQSVSAPRAAPSQNPVDPVPPQRFAPLLPSVTLAAVPETLTVSRSSAPKRTVTGAPAPNGMKPLVRPSYQDLPDLQRPPQTPLTALNSPHASAIAPPETINPPQPAVPSIPVNPTPPSATLTNPAPPAQPSAESSPVTPLQAESKLTVPTPAESATAPPAVSTNDPTTNPAPVNSTSDATDIEDAQWRSQKSGVD